MLSLKELLQNFSPERLDDLRKALHLKADAADLSRLLQRLDNSDRTRRVFAELEPTEKHVLRYLLSQGGSASEKEIIDRFPESPPALVKLREHYLIFEDPEVTAEPMLCVPREYQRFIPLTPAEKSTLAALMTRQPPAFQADLAQTFGWDASAKRHQASALKREWLSEDRLRLFLEALPDSEKAVWRLFIDSDGIVDSKALQRAGISKTALQPGHLDRSQPLENLYAHGLIFPNQLPNPSCYVAPSDVLGLLKGRVELPAFHVSEHAPAQLRAWGLRLLSDLQLFSAYQASGRMQFTQNDIPLRHQLRAFLKGLGIAEENYGLFLNVSTEAFFGAVIKRTTHTLDANPAESMSRLIVFWRDGDLWQESAHWRDAHRSVDGQLDKTLKAKRLIALKALEALPTRQWVKYEEFEEFIFTLGWKRVDSGVHRNNAYYHNERWPRREFVPDLSPEETLANLTAESLVWLGLVDVGIGRPRKNAWEITHLRLTDWGRQFLDKKSGRFEPLPPVRAETHFSVLPNLEISVTPRLRPDLLAQLFKMAVLKGVNSFSITKESLREALDEGMTLVEILAFLTANSSAPVPFLVQQFVEEVSQKHGHIKLGIAGAYLQVDDPVLLVELRAHRALKDVFHKQVGDKLAILNDRDLDRIAKALRKLGYLPVIEKSDQIDRLKSKVHW